MCYFQRTAAQPHFGTSTEMEVFSTRPPISPALIFPSPQSSDSVFLITDRKKFRLMNASRTELRAADRQGESAMLVCGMHTLPAETCMGLKESLFNANRSSIATCPPSRSLSGNFFHPHLRSLVRHSQNAQALVAPALARTSLLAPHICWLSTQG